MCITSYVLLDHPAITRRWVRIGGSTADVCARANFPVPWQSKNGPPQIVKLCSSVEKKNRQQVGTIEETPPFSAVPNPVCFTSLGRKGSQCPCVGGVIRSSFKGNGGWCGYVGNYAVLSLQGPSLLEGSVCWTQW